jgi:hypothetical protein
LTRKKKDGSVLALRFKRKKKDGRKKKIDVGVQNTSCCESNS